MYPELVLHIGKWLQDHLSLSCQKGFVVGVSGGVDSAVVSTLCATTQCPTLVVSLPICQDATQLERCNKHIAWLTERYPNVTNYEIDLGRVLTQFENDLWPHIWEQKSCELVSANLRSRLRMCALYAFANANNYLVIGTGNKIEDYGVGFFTKGGDGMVDLSPIGDLLKSEVKKLALELNIIPEICAAVPTDGLWGDNRSDEDQLAATYDELEWAMWYCERFMIDTNVRLHLIINERLTERQHEVLRIYYNRNKANQHKMRMPPVCRIDMIKSGLTS